MGFVMKLVALLLPANREIERRAMSWVLFSPDSVLRAQRATGAGPVVLRILMLFAAAALAAGALLHEHGQLAARGRQHQVFVQLLNMILEKIRAVARLVVGGIDAVQVFAGDVHEGGQPGSGADEDGARLAPNLFSYSTI